MPVFKTVKMLQYVANARCGSLSVGNESYIVIKGYSRYILLLQHVSCRFINRIINTLKKVHTLRVPRLKYG